ncbi:MAG: tetratricopeptide repeat protein [Anaerolineae bacterium]|nr:tetratricopeptide repeat protein [Anaerolineae bacterium]
MLRAHLLGGLALAWDAEPLPAIQSGAARSLLSFLITYRDRPHTRDLLAGTFWPDLPDTVARRRLRQALWQIRRALDPHPVFVTEGGSVQLNPGLPVWVDVEAFAGRPQQGVSGDAEALAHDEQCLEYYRGEFLAGYYEDWILVERERLRGLLLEVLKRLANEARGRGDYERALTYARRLAVEDPWTEEVHQEVMRLCHLLGRDAEALRQYAICRQFLADELGVAPSPETTALLAEITARSDLPTPPLLPAGPRPATTPYLERPDRLPLIGRSPEVAELLRQVEAARDGGGGLTLLYGEAGVGKSRLLRELAENARWRGVHPLWGRCYELAAPLAYQPLVEALRDGLPSLVESALPPLWRAELARLLPELATGQGPPPTLPKEEEKRRLLEAIAQGFLTLAEGGCRLVLLEDVQWMDLASLEAVRYLQPRLGDAPLLVVMAVRTEELAPDVASALAALERTRLSRRMLLERLSTVTTAELVQRALDLERPAPRFSERLYAETEGNPFFVVETLRTLVEEGVLFRDARGGWSTPWDKSTQDYAEMPLPAGVVQSIESRLARLPARLTEALNTAATIGRRLEFGLWLAATGWEESDLLAAGDALCARGLFLAPDPALASESDFIFAHDLIRRVAYGRLSKPRRRLCHRRVAEALTLLGRDEPEALAYHWTQAEAWEKAADYHRQAGDKAWTVYAHAGAVDHYGRALKALERMPGPPDPARAFPLRLSREAVYDLQGDREAQAQELDALTALSRDLGADQRADVALRRAAYAIVIGDYPAAVAAARETLEEAHVAAAADDVATPQSPTAHEAMAHLHWGTVLWHQGEYGPARSRLEHALHLAEAASTGKPPLRPVVGDIRLSLGRLLQSQGDYAQAGAHFAQALELYREAGDLRGQAAALENLGAISRLQADYAEARAHIEQALRLFSRIGDRQGEGRALHRLGSVAINQGDHATARTHLESALHIAGEIEDRVSQGSLFAALGVLANRECDYPAARGHLERALEIDRALGERRDEGIALTSLAIVLYCLGEYPQATTCAEQARQIGLELGDLRYQAWALHTLGRVAAQQGRSGEARRHYGQGLRIAQFLGDRQLESIVLSGLGLLAHQIGDDGAALEHAQQALAIVEAIGEPVDTGYALTVLGHALVGMGRLDEAVDAYRRAVEVRRGLGQHNLATEPQAGLARIVLAWGDLALARSHVKVILSHLETGTLDGAEEAPRVYLTCYRVLEAAHDRRADDILTAAHDLIERRAVAADLPAHREILAAWQERQASRRIVVRLPRSDAVRTPSAARTLDAARTLGVCVTWTVTDAGDEAVEDKGARRRKRLARLLDEAKAQGAAPTYQHLADALGVSRRTIARDMALLRAQQEPAPPSRDEMSA